MTRDFEIKMMESASERGIQTSELIRKTFSIIGEDWQRTIPSDTGVVATCQNAYVLEPGNSSTLVAKVARGKGCNIQASILRDTIYACYSNTTPGLHRLFQYEMLAVFAYAMCRNGSFLKCLGESFSTAKNNQEVFANNFPLLFTYSGVTLLKNRGSDLFRRMNDLQNSIKSALRRVNNLQDSTKLILR